MKLLRKTMALALSLGLLLSATACTYKDKPVDFNLPSTGKVLFKMGDLQCTKAEALTYLLNEKNIYGTVEGTNLWASDFNTTAITDSLKDATLEHLTKVFVLDLYATEQGLELSEDELASIDQAAAEYYASLNDSELEYTGATEQDISNMYQHYALASKVYTSLMDSVDEEVSEDEARVMEAYVLFVTDESTAQEVAGLIRQGLTFERLAATYTELDTYQVTFARNEYPANVDEVVFNLDTDEVSEAIEADGGYYFFQCLDKYNEELSEENKTVIIDARRAQVLSDIENEIKDRYFSTIDTELWDSLTIDSADSDNLLSSSFFSTLSNYISY